MPRILTSLVVLVCVLSSPGRGADVDVFLFGGQSNMQGSGKVADLPADVPREPPRTFFWNGRDFEPLVVGTTLTAKRPGEFGPEIGFAVAWPDDGRPRYLVKYASGGVPLHHGVDAADWVGDEPGPGRRNFNPGDRADDPNQGTFYRAMIDRFRDAIAALRRRGDTPRVRGLLWMQGEADAKHERAALAYAASLRRLRDRLAEDLGVDTLPIVFGQVLPHEPAKPAFTHRREIRAAMAAADERSGRPEAIPHARMVSSDGFTLLPDVVHHDAAGLMRLGRALAAALVSFAEPAAATETDGPRGGPAIAPREKITLYDGSTVADLRHFTTWLADHRHDDPDRVFTVVDQVDGAPAIRISGEDWGGLISRESYRDYRLVLEWRWGTVTWKKRMQRARNSGLLFHCQGEDGNHVPEFTSPWIRSIEYEIQEGRTGAVILVGGFDRGRPEPIRPRVTMRTKADKIWDPAGEPQVFDQKFLYQSTYDTGWKDVLGARGPRDLDAPVGAWNRVEVVTQGGAITYFLNGTKIMELSDSSFQEGRVMLQSEGAEIFYRLVELHPAAGGR